MARVPIVQIGNTLIATVQDELRDRDALDLLTELGSAVEQRGSRGIILDISVVETVDSFLGRVVADLANTMRLLGAHIVVVGMHPYVAITLVELGVEMRGVRTALNAEKGAAVLKKVFVEEDRRGRRTFR